MDSSNPLSSEWNTSNVGCQTVTRQQYERVIRKENFLYYVTLDGECRINIQTQEIVCLLKLEDSMIFKGFDRIARMTITKKNEEYVLITDTEETTCRMSKITI